MDALWIILIAVLLGSLLLVVAVLFVYRLAWWQIKEAEKSDAADTDPEHIQPDIPVWRDKPTSRKIE